MIDSHCHLADEAFEADLTDVVERARGAGLHRALCILEATSANEASRSDAVSSVWPAVQFSVGVHPHKAGEFTSRLDGVEPALREAIDRRAGTCAGGEIGLDYHYDFAPAEIQQEVFRRQIRVARDLALPIVIHTREADDDTLAILEEEGAPAVPGVFHCFTGDATMALRAVELGFHVSFSGIATFKSAETVREAAVAVPSDRLLVETDAPYLAPVPYRGQRNEPAWVGSVVDRLAEIRGVTPEVLRGWTDENFSRLFGGVSSKGLS